MKRIIITTVIFLGANAVEGKGIKPIEVGATANVTTGLVAPSLHAIKYFSLKKKAESKFRIGAGIRLTSSNTGGCKDYITAPASLTSTKATVDTIGFDQVNANALNLVVALNYKFTKKLDVEFNIDAIGASFGAEQDVFLRNKPGIDVNGVAGKAKPTALNALLVGDNDFGTLSSEMVLGYRLTPNLKLKLGAGFLFTEMKLTTDKYNNLAGTLVDNNRFRNKALGGSFGFTYSLK
jgi:hypothetical protein